MYLTKVNVEIKSNFNRIYRHYYPELSDIISEYLYDDENEYLHRIEQDIFNRTIHIPEDAKILSKIKCKNCGIRSVNGIGLFLVGTNVYYFKDSYHNKTEELYDYCHNCAPLRRCYDTDVDQFCVYKNICRNCRKKYCNHGGNYGYCNKCIRKVPVFSKI